jgi:mRNA interferase YafQ
MRTIERTNRFKKEYLRRVAGTPLESELDEIVFRLAAGSPLPERYRDHPLKGALAGTRDFHLRPDLIVIYELTSTAVKFRRMGSHSELFGR